MNFGTEEKKKEFEAALDQYGDEAKVNTDIADRIIVLRIVIPNLRQIKEHADFRDENPLKICDDFWNWAKTGIMKV